MQSRICAKVSKLVVVIVLMSPLALSQEFWTRQQVTWQSVNFATGIADSVNSCEHSHWVERTAPTQTCAGITAWVMGGKVVELGASVLLSKHGHPKVALAIPRIASVGSGVALTYTLWPRGK
jgi:hypothetical protein